MAEGKPGRPDQASDQLLGAAGLSVERMPMLHVIFDQLTNLCAESLRSMSPSQSYFSLSSVGRSSPGKTARPLVTAFIAVTISSSFAVRGRIARAPA